jgi:hypothetical protein
MACSVAARQDREMRFRREMPVQQLDAVIELLSGLGTMLMAIDDKLGQIVELFEEDA